MCFLITGNLRGFAPKPPAGTPSLHPDSTRRRAGGTEENRFHSSGCYYATLQKVAFSLITGFDHSVLPDVGNPWGAFTGHPAERPSSTKIEICRHVSIETTIFRTEYSLLCGSALIRTQKLNFFLEIFSNDIFILSRRKYFIFSH